MSDVSSIKPYLIRAVHQWCTDNMNCPHISVLEGGCSGIPAESFKDGEIILNISYQATSDLLIDNETIRFVARFNGVSRQVEIMIGAVVAIFARESGQGLTFTPEINKTAVPDEQENSVDHPVSQDSQVLSIEGKRGKPFLKIIK